jgi:MFS transporter, DHA1 family, multidrug resistance protein
LHGTTGLHRRIDCRRRRSGFGIAAPHERHSGSGLAGRISEARPHLGPPGVRSVNSVCLLPQVANGAPMVRPNTFSMTALLALLTAFGPVATDMYVPSLPDIGRLLGADPATVQLTLSAYLMGFAAGQVVYGPLSDRWGRKPTLLVALALFCAASLMCAVAPTIETLIAARALQALGGSGAIVLARAVARDLYSGERAGQELSRMGAVMSFAPVIAPLVGGVVQTSFGWRANFIIIVAVGIVTMLITWRSLPETRPRQVAQPKGILDSVRQFRALAADRSFVAHLAIIASTYAGLFAWISGSPFVLQDVYGLSPLWFGVAFAAACLGAIVGATMASSLVMRIGLDRTIGLGALALTVGGLAMVSSLAAGAAPIPSIVLSMVMYHAGIMLAMPQAIAGAMTPFPDCAGTASSFVGVIQQTSAAVVGAIVGHLIGQSAWPLAGSVALMGCLALAVWASTRRIRASRTPTSDARVGLAAEGRLTAN